MVEHLNKKQIKIKQQIFDNLLKQVGMDNVFLTPGETGNRKYEPFLGGEIATSRDEKEGENEDTDGNESLITMEEE